MIYVYHDEDGNNGDMFPSWYIWEYFWGQVMVAALLAWIDNSDNIEALPPSELWNGQFYCPEQWI